MNSPGHVSNRKTAGQPVRPRRWRKTVFALLILAAVGGAGTAGYLLQTRRKAEEAARTAEMERQRHIEEERQRQAAFLAGKRAEFDSLLTEMRAALKSGAYSRVQQLAGTVRPIAEQYGFPTDEVDALCARARTAVLQRTIDRLEQQAADPFAYVSVRRTLSRLSAGGTLGARIRRLRRITEINEYHVLLTLARDALDRGLSGVQPDVHYELSRVYYHQAVTARTRFGLKPDTEQEDAIMRDQRQLFFATETLRERTIPRSVY